MCSQSWGSSRCGAPRRRGRWADAVVIGGGESGGGCLSQAAARRVCSLLLCSNAELERLLSRPARRAGYVGVVPRRRRAGDGCERSSLVPQNPSKNPSISVPLAHLTQDLAALTDGTSHPPPRQRSRKVQDSIELVSEPPLRRNRLIRHSSTVCGEEPQNFTQSDRRHASPRKVTHTRDAIDAALRPTPPFRRNAPTFARAPGAPESRP